jgi:hypothetical protein
MAAENCWRSELRPRVKEQVLQTPEEIPPDNKAKTEQPEHCSRTILSIFEYLLCLNLFCAAIMEYHRLNNL